MKTAALFSIIVLTSVLLLSLRPESNVASIEMEILNCRDSNTVDIQSVEIFKDGKKYRALSPEAYEPVRLDTVPLGTYEFRYTSMFGMPASVTVDAKKPGAYTGVLCTNYFNYSAEKYHPLIDRLHPGEKYLIFCKSVGCFHRSEESLWIIRTDSSFTAEHWQDESYTSKALDASQVETIRRFELELNHMNRGRCTTTDTYRIRFNGRTIKHVEDGSCSWAGFPHLLRDLGFTKE